MNNPQETTTKTDPKVIRLQVPDDQQNNPKQNQKNPKRGKVRALWHRITNAFNRATRNCVLWAMILMAAMSYIIVNHPELQTQCPAIFWIAQVYVNAVEVVCSCVKLLLQMIVGFPKAVFGGSFSNFTSQLSANWEAIENAISAFISSIV